MLSNLWNKEKTKLKKNLHLLLVHLPPTAPTPHHVTEPDRSSCPPWISGSSSEPSGSILQCLRLVNLGAWPASFWSRKPFIFIISLRLWVYLEKSRTWAILSQSHPWHLSLEKQALSSPWLKSQPFPHLWACSTVWLPTPRLLAKLTQREHKT